MRKTTLKVASSLLLAAAAFSFMSCGEEETGKGKYTYRDATGNYKTWSPTDWEMHDEYTILTLITTPLYDFVLNETKDGHEVIPNLAEKEPEDVTAQYAGDPRYGVPAGATSGYARKITLEKNITWDDGTPINADTVEYSLKQFLNPEMKNYRANSFYADSLALANARSYYEGSVAYVDATGPAEGLYTTLTQPVAFFGGAAKGYGPDSSYADSWIVDGVDLYAKLEGLIGEHSYTEVTPEIKEILITMTKAFGDDPNNWYQWCCTREEKVPAKWEDVGFIKNDEYTFTLITAANLDEFFFYYYSNSLYLIKEDLYEANKKATGDIIKSSYGTTVEKSASYGPYKVTDFQQDKSIHLSKNENWFGYKNPKHAGKYMMTDYDAQVITDHETVKNLFLQGKLEYFPLSVTDMDQYGNSDYRRVTPQTYTYKFTLNMDRRALEKENGDGVNHSILANIDFRHAMSLSLDRQSWIETVSPASQPGYGLLNYIYVAVPATGQLYRDTEPAKQALLNHYNASSLEDVTGYDLVEARRLFQKAYDDEVKAGYLKSTDRIEFDIHIYANSEAYMRRVNFLQDALNKATEGTSLEGKVSLNTVVDQNYYDNVKKGIVDICITAWGGSDMDPYGTLWCYCTDEAKNEYGLPIHDDPLTINVEGKNYTYTLDNWYVELCDSAGKFVGASGDAKNVILAAVEERLLSYYDMIPMQYLSELDLTSQRYSDGADHYVNSIVLFGGLREATFSMDDAEWDAYCKKQNYQLSY